MMGLAQILRSVFAMAHFHIDGCWEGQYWYDTQETLDTVPVPVRFTLTAQGGWFGRFKGIVQDDPTRCASQSASVRGRRRGRSLTFLKRYPTLFMWREGRAVTLAEYLLAEHGWGLDHEVEAVPVFYEGEYNDDDRSLSGSWCIDTQQVTFWSAGRPCTMEFPGTSGRWHAERLHE